MKRKIIVILSVLAILVCCSVPAFAVTRDPFKYISGATPDGSYTEYLFDLSSLAVDATWISTSAEDTFTGTGAEISVGLVEDDVTIVEFEPFGYGNSLDWSSFPAGTSFQLDINFLIYFSHDTDIEYSLYIWYHDSNGDIFAQDMVSGTTDGYISTDIDIYPEYDASSISFGYELDVGALYDGEGIIEFDEMYLHATVLDSAMTQSQQQAIKDKLDQIINGYEPDPDDPSNGLGDAYDDAEQEVIDKVETGRDQIVDIIDEFGIYLEEFLPGIVVVSNWLNILLELKFIRVLLFFSLAFGMCGLFFGVANSFRGKS